MSILIVLLFPPLIFFLIGRPVAGIICLLLYLTIIGWFPAVIWALHSLNSFETDRKLHLLKADFNRKLAALKPAPEKPVRKKKHK